MKRLFGMAVMISVLSLSLAGCTDKAKMEKQTTVETEGGTTTTTQTETVEKSGENPPAAQR